MPEAVKLSRVAGTCLKGLGEFGRPTRLVLSLFYKAILGIPRIFHFDSLGDVGFAILTGGKTVLGRNALGGLVRAAPVRGVLALVKKTEARVPRSKILHISIDEHAVARFTRKFAIKKGYHTIRNKRMKIEKLFFSYCVRTHRLLSIVVTRGNARLSDLSIRLLERLRRRARGAQIRVILDAGAAENYDRLLEVTRRRNQVTLVRTPRRPSYRKQWKSIPKSAWTDLEEAGPYLEAPPKRISIAESRMKVAGTDVRTVVIRERARRGKDRWHALWVFGDELTPAYDIVREFRERQDHEQTYRIMLHDLFGDTAPSGYNKQSKNPRRPGFQQNALTLYSWIAALAANTLLEFARALPAALPPGKHNRYHPRTLRRWLFVVPAEIWQTSNTLIVHLDPSKLGPLWVAIVDRFNARPVRIPWLDNRRIVLSLNGSRPELGMDPGGNRTGVWC